MNYSQVPPNPQAFLLSGCTTLYSAEAISPTTRRPMARAGSAAAAAAAVLVGVLMAVAFSPSADASHFYDDLPPGVITRPPTFLVSESPAPSSSLDARVFDVADAFPNVAAPIPPEQPAVDVSATSAFLNGARRAGPVILP